MNSKLRLAQKKEIEQLLRGILVQHLSSAVASGKCTGPVIGNLIISPFEKSIDWLPGPLAGVEDLEQKLVAKRKASGEAA